jgi:hypothetical protein
LKVSGSFYEEFKNPIAAKAVALGRAEKKGGSGKSVEEITSLVQAAVVSVMGSAVGPDQPLVEAGLDSLGENTPEGG